MNLTVVGLGLLGGSFALGVRELEPLARITGVDRADVLAHPAAGRAADRLVDADDQEAVDAALSEADLVLLAAPVQAIALVLPRALAHAKLVTDCGSTKAAVVRAAESLPRRRRFVPGHPMAGAPTGGIEAARPGLFRGRRWLICPEASDTDAVETVEALVRRLGAEPIRLSATAHDRAVALTSHATQLVASALSVVALEAGAEPAIGPAFEGATRVAGGPEEMWSDIFSTNAAAIAEALSALEAELGAVRRGLEQAIPDRGPALALLARARRLRRNTL
jgi:prephenate dehydrogenase